MVRPGQLQGNTILPVVNYTTLHEWAIFDRVNHRGIRSSNPSSIAGAHSYYPDKHRTIDLSLVPRQRKAFSLRHLSLAGRRIDYPLGYGSQDHGSACRTAATC